MNLYDLLKSYRDITLSTIEYVENYGFKDLDNLFGQRQKIIDLISSMEYSKNDFKSIGEELNLLFLDRKLKRVMEEKKEEAKLNLNKLMKVKKANNNYNKIQLNSVIFSKKV